LKVGDKNLPSSTIDMMIPKMATASQKMMDTRFLDLMRGWVYAFVVVVVVVVAYALLRIWMIQTHILH
jgi:hypothetical protein